MAGSVVVVGQVMEGLVVLLAVVAAAAGLGVWLSRSGRRLGSSGSDRSSGSELVTA